MYLLGYDIGSSSVKAALVAVADGRVLATVQAPETEMPIAAPQPGWAEQDPGIWWQQVVAATRKLHTLHPGAMRQVEGIGIAYQMHGLVLVDKALQPLRPAIIWCDSRAVDIGQRAFREIGKEKCLEHLLNSPGNFTASKLAWVRQNEPAIFRRAYKMMLPGDYIALRMTGRTCTTPAGLSEGILWDYRKNAVANFVLDYFKISPDLLPEIVPNSSNQGRLTQQAAAELGLPSGITVGYRAGDQPNNALSLNVLNPGEVAATGGTSGVVYAVTGELTFDPLSRVNSFAHLNHRAAQPRIGVLLCINGAGIQYSWMRLFMTCGHLSFQDMTRLAASVPVGSGQLKIFPFGNGAERMLGNRQPGAHICKLDFNRHSNAHLYRAALEGVAFSFVFGMRMLQSMGLDLQIIRVGHDNLFRAPVFAQTISNVMNCNIEVVATTGAVGAARAAGISTGHFSGWRAAMQNLDIVRTYHPAPDREPYIRAYADWEAELNTLLALKTN